MEKKKGFKQLQKEELKNIKGGDKAHVDSGEQIVIEYSLPINPPTPIVKG